MKYNETLSSSHTIFYKYFIPVIWLIVFGEFVIAINSGMSIKSSQPEFVKKIANWGFLITTPCIFYFAFIIKTVVRKNDKLIVTGYKHKSVVSLSDVIKFDINMWTRPELIKCTIRNYDKTVYFVPKLSRLRVVALLDSYDKELEELNKLLTTDKYP